MLELLKAVNTSILERLDLAPLKQGRFFISGAGGDLFAGELVKKAQPEKTKIFINLPFDVSYSLPEYMTLLKGEFHEKLLAFPPDTFDLVVTFWNISLAHPELTIKTVRRSLKKGGQFALITSLEGSPKIIMQIFARIFKERSSANLKMYRSALPENVAGLRKLFEKSGFAIPRVWPEKMTRFYKTADEVFNEMVNQSELGFFDDKVDEETKAFVKRRFGELIEKYRQPTEPKEIVIPFELAGVIAVK
jgi:SAM-dependent methyltransferase